MERHTIINRFNTMLTPARADRQLTYAIRMLSLACGVTLAILLAVAFQLRPNPAGLGTHQQLGLPPCSVVVLCGVPCPSCGMTTSWAFLTRGEIGSAFQANVGGAMLALIAMAYIPASCYFFLSGRATRRGWFCDALAICLTLALVATLAQWVVRVWA